MYKPCGPGSQMSLENSIQTHGNNQYAAGCPSNRWSDGEEETAAPAPRSLRFGIHGISCQCK